MKTLILIPTLNEEGQIAAVIARAKEEIPEARVLVVNDGSSDQTEQKAREAGAKVLSHPFNLGYGAALQTGYKYALRHDCDYVLQMDGDGQHDADSLRKILREVSAGRADIVIGSRFLGEVGYPVPRLRRLAIGFFGLIASRLMGQRITDPTSGFQALNRRAVKFCAGEAFPGDYPDADVLVMMHRAGLRVREVPVGMHPGCRGHSMHSGLKPLYYMYKMLLSLALNLIRSEKTGV